LVKVSMNSSHANIHSFRDLIDLKALLPQFYRASWFLLRACPKSALGGFLTSGYAGPHETEFIPHGFDRCPVGTDCSLGPPAQAGGTSTRLHTAGNCGGDSVSDAQRLHVAIVAARLPTVSDRVSLFPALAAGRNLGNPARQAAGARAVEGGEDSQALGSDPRQPKREDHRTRGAARL